MTPEQVDEAKRNGAWLYSEHHEPQNRIFPVHEWSRRWSDDGRHDPARRLDDEPEDERTITFTRLQLGELLGQVVDMMGSTRCLKVRYHSDLVRCALKLPGALSQAAIARKYGVYKSTVHRHVEHMTAPSPIKRNLFHSYNTSRSGTLRRKNR